jgi:FeS assembly SUF system protein
VNEERKIAVEQVDAVEAPPKARVEAVLDVASETSAGVAETFERKRDYLTGFLSQKPESHPAGEPGGELYESVITALKEIYDPEIPVNIYDLGLIYGVDITADGHASVQMTLTTPHCPVAESMPGEVELRVGSVPGIGHAEVNLVWDPPWDPQKMTDDAKLELGML